MLLNLRADAIATGGYFIVETMGRKSGWLSYGVAIAGEANLVIAPEDIDEELLENGKLSLSKLTARIVDLILHRETLKKHYGTVVVAEGLAEILPDDVLARLPRDQHGHIVHGRVDLGKIVAQHVAEEYLLRTERRKKVSGVQLGYESRSSVPHAFDVMLGSQLGVGAFRALVEEGLDGYMVSIVGQLDLAYVPFSDLIDSETMLATVRYIQHGSDFHRLARFLETRTDRILDWKPARRRE